MYSILYVVIIFLLAVILVGAVAAAVLIPITRSLSLAMGLKVTSETSAEACKKRRGAKITVRYYPSAPGTPEYFTDDGVCGILVIRNKKGKTAKIPLEFLKDTASYKCISLYPDEYTVSYFTYEGAPMPGCGRAEYFSSERVILSEDGVLSFACRTNGRERNLIKL